MNGTGYDAANKVSVAHFTKDQRARLEALTAAKALRGGNATDEWLTLAAFIATGARR